MPISFQNIINNVSGQLNLDTNSVVDITPLEAFELIETYFGKLNGFYYMKENELLKALYFII